MSTKPAAGQRIGALVKLHIEAASLDEAEGDHQPTGRQKLTDENELT
jgi:hypothetical protein